MIINITDRMFKLLFLGYNPGNVFYCYTILANMVVVTLML